MINYNIVSTMNYGNAAEQWLTNAIVKSVVESTLGFSVDDGLWQFNWVEYYPVWTIDSNTKQKAVKRIYVRLRGAPKFSEIGLDLLEPHGLTSYNEMLFLFEQSGASRVSNEGIQILKTRLDYH